MPEYPKHHQTRVPNSFASPALPPRHDNTLRKPMHGRLRFRIPASAVVGMRPYSPGGGLVGIGVGGGRIGIAFCVGTDLARLSRDDKGAVEADTSVDPASAVIVGGGRRGIGTCGVSARARLPKEAPGPDAGADCGIGASCAKRTWSCRRREGSGCNAVFGAGHPSTGTPAAAASAAGLPSGGYCSLSTHRVCHKACCNASSPYIIAQAVSDAAWASCEAPCRHHRHQ